MYSLKWCEENVIKEIDELQAYWSTSEIDEDNYTLNGDPLFIDNFRIYYAKNKNRS